MLDAASDQKEAVMGIFDDLAGKLQGMFGGAGGEHAALIKAVMETLSQGQGAGLTGLVESFQQKGLGDIASSWIGTGQNAPISADQLKDGMGRELLETIAAKAGLSTDEAADKLSEHLPNIIDKLTPDGALPGGGMLEKGLEMLKSKP